MSGFYAEGLFTTSARAGMQVAQQSQATASNATPPPTVGTCDRPNGKTEGRGRPLSRPTPGAPDPKRVNAGEAAKESKRYIRTPCLASGPHAARDGKVRRRYAHTAPESPSKAYKGEALLVLA